MSKRKPKQSKSRRTFKPKPPALVGRPAPDPATWMPADAPSKRLHPPAMVNEVLEFLRCHSWDDEIESEKKNEGRIFIDATLGTAGHTIAILKSNEQNRVIAFDRDAESMYWARRRLEDENLLERVALVQSDFRFAPFALEKLQQAVKAGDVNDANDKSRADESTPMGAFYAGATNLENSEADLSETSEESESSVTSRVLFIGQEFLRRRDEVLVGNIAGALVDAGMSMFQIAWEERGLSFQSDAPLDMRYDRTRGLSAFDLINQLSQNELEDLFFKFTDERWARRIAAIITEHRRRQVINTTSELVSLIEAAIPIGVRRSMRVHPATRVFAALRLAVNDEFWALEEGVWAISSVLVTTARLVVLTYSSHEDRTVKRTFRRLAARSSSQEDEYTRQETAALSTPPRVSSMRSPLTFSQDEFAFALPTEYSHLEPPEFLASHLKEFGSSWHMKIVTNKPVQPDEIEVANNPLSRSCKLRAIEKTEALPAAKAAG